MKIENINFNYSYKTKIAGAQKDNNFLSFASYNLESNYANTVFEHFNAIKNYNIPFLGSKAKTGENNNKEIYVIDAYQNFKKFNNPYEAASAFNIDLRKILRCANGDSESEGDFLFAFADNVEMKQNGKMVPDKVIINLASEVLRSIAAFKTVPLTIDEAIELKVKSKSKAASKAAKEKAEQAKIEDATKPVNKIDGAIYAIDKNKKCMKFDKIQELLDTLDISKSSVYKCLRKEKEHINGVVFCLGSEIETMNEDGEIVPNNRLVKKQIKCLEDLDAFATLDLLILKKKGAKSFDEINPAPRKVKSGILGTIPEEDLSNVQLRYLLKPFYVVDEEENYRKFYLQKYVADKLGIYEDKISDCLQKRIKSIKGYKFIYASEVEKIDKDGKISVDEDKLFKRKNSDVDFYFVDKDLKYKKFNNVVQAHNDLGISYNNILSCILGRQNKTSNIAFVKSSDFEIENEDGTITINREKLLEIKNLLNKDAVYIADENMQYKRYDTRADAARAIDATPQEISAAIAGRRKTVHGYIAIDANKIEELIEDGTIKVNTDKIVDALNASTVIRKINVSENGFYAIDKMGNYQKFYDIKQASTELKIPYIRIFGCLLGVDKMAKGYVFALGEDIEIENKDGTKMPDVAKIAEKAAYFESKAIYAICKVGKCIKFSSQKEASDILGIPLRNISRCINKKIKETYGYSFLFASEVELETEDGKTILDDNLIQEKINYLNKDVVYAIDEDNNCKRFDNRDLAEEALGVKKSSIAECLKGRHKTSHGYVFAHFWEVVTKREDGTYGPDENKIKEKNSLRAA